MTNESKTAVPARRIFLKDIGRGAACAGVAAGAAGLLAAAGSAAAASETAAAGDPGSFPSADYDWNKHRWAFAVDATKCIGCAGCANNCPAREILIFDVCQEIRVLHYLGRRCTYCGRCADVCPEKAITMSQDFETATDQIGDLQQHIELFMSTCQRCGRCFTEPSPLEQLKLKGYRSDDLETERVIFHSDAYLKDEPIVDDINIELD